MSVFNWHSSLCFVLIALSAMLTFMVRCVSFTVPSSCDFFSTVSYCTCIIFSELHRIKCEVVVWFPCIFLLAPSLRLNYCYSENNEWHVTVLQRFALCPSVVRSGDYYLFETDSEEEEEEEEKKDDEPPKKSAFQVTNFSSVVAWECFNCLLRSFNELITCFICSVET